MNQIIYSQGAISVASFVPRKQLLSMWQNLVLLFVIAQLFPQDGPLAVDLLLTVWKLIFVINTQTEVMIWSSCLHKGGGFGSLDSVRLVLVDQTPDIIFYRATALE